MMAAKTRPGDFTSRSFEASLLQLGIESAEAPNEIDRAPVSCRCLPLPKAPVPAQRRIETAGREPALERVALREKAGHDRRGASSPPTLMPM